MHGRVCEGRNKSRRRHMLISSSRVIASLEGGASSSPLSQSSSTSFSKDGRKISVGDCALFKPPQDCPPFIGIIRLIIAEKEDKLKLGVNWLYRPTELKLGKGILVEAEPNELFYSFHEDNIPAASLLHPCKVAFLPRGVELPSGICSFVCRRVYDVTNERLWWLTDQDYIDDRQLEVDKLLCKTRSEMHTTLQQGGRSPKSMNSPTTSQPKDGIQNSNSFLSQGKGRKRERIDHGSESVKRERSTRMDDSGSGPLRTESSLKSEISKFTEKGGLVDSEGVEKLVQLMLPERNEKKIDLVCRAILAGVVAATDKFDCLSRFVQLRGLPVFDEWLQEVHKGKVGDGGSPKDGDRSVDDFLLVLLRALDKLPVNLNALQTCNIGKSVNHLRSHKNSEIGKKARSLVDTWKKRVEAEMDAKSGSNQGVSWPGRLTHGGRHSGGSAEANKTSSSQLHASKSVSIKVENNLKPLATSPGSTRSAPSPGSGGTVSKDGQQRNAGAGGVSENQAVVKDEKSSSSSQSHNNSQSCSSEHAKTGNLSGKEDARSSTAGSTVKKCSSRHRKSNNVFQGSASSASPREAGLSRSFSSQRNTPSEKISQSSLTSEKTLEVPLTEGCSNKLIVKLPKRGRSPAQSVSGGSFEDHAPVNSRASSPVHVVKQELCDNSVREKVNSSRANASSVLNAESWQSNEFKDIMTGSHEPAGSPLVVAGDEHSRTLKDSGKAAVNVKVTSSSPGNEFKSGERHGGTLSSMNALIESCVRYSETNASLAGSDDVGMNLLASVAADEMSKSPVASPSVSQPSNSLMNESSTGGNNTKLIASDGLPREKHQAVTQDRTTCSNEQGEQHVSNGGMQLGNSEIKNDSKTGDLDKSSNSDTEDLQRLVDQRLESNDNSDDVVASPALPTTAVKEKSLDDSDFGEVNERNADVKSEADCISDSTKRIASSMPTECRAIAISRKVDSMSVEHSPSDGVGEIKKEQLPPAALRSELVKKIGEDVPVSSGISRAMDAVSIDRVVSEKVDNMAVNHIDQKDKNKIKQECDASVAVGKDASAGLDSSVTKGKVEPLEGNLENTEVKERYSGPRANPGVSSPKDAEDLKRPNGLKASDADGDEAEECTSAARDASSASAAASAGSEMDARVEFDLNEGFDGDDAKHGDSNNFSGSVFLTPSPLQPVNTLPFPAAPVSSGLPASITVAAAAKGPFVPPEDLLRNKGAVGWRGSAATSAFRPAEPRKAQDVLLSTNNASTSDASTSAGKQTRTFLDFDLNVPDERLLEDLPSQRSGNATNSTPGVTNSFDQVRPGFMGSALDHSSGGLDLDLNKVDDSTDMNNYPMSSSHRLDSSFHQVKLSSPGGRRDFDLNDGPAGDDAAVESSMVLSQQSRSGLLPSQPSLSGIRVNGENMASFSTWFPAANAYSAVSIPPIMPERGDQPFPMIANRGQQRMLGPTTGVSSFTPEGYRGPVLSSSPAMPFQSTTFQYPVFPFGNSFPIASANFSGASTAHMDSSSSGRACFPGVNSQILGAGVTVPANYPRPYIVGLPNGGSNGGVLDNNAKWFRSSGLDLNSGPGGHETEGRDESTHVPRQLSSSASLPLKEDQARMYQMSGGVLKRKEPEGGWDGYRQSSWQ